jgi:BolA protein
MNRPTLDELQARLVARFPDASIELQDDSHLHAGHAGASGGAGHYTVRIRSSAFAGQRVLARHRLVYDAVRDWMPDRIHALVIDAQAPLDASVSSPSQ